MTAQTPKGWPPGAHPRLMGVDKAAYYCGVSKNTFLRWVEAGTVPPGHKEGARVLWDKPALDAAIDRMFGNAQPSGESLESDADRLRRAIDGRKTALRDQANRQTR